MSRGDDTIERLRSLRGIRPFEERAERPSVFCVSYHPFAGRGPCGRPHPRWEIGYPAMADGHKVRALQEDRNVRPIVKGSIGYQQNGHLQGAALVAVRTQDGKLVTLQRRTCLSVICSSVVGLLRWKEYIKKHKKFLIFLINILDFIVLCKIRNNDRTIEYII